MQHLCDGLRSTCAQHNENIPFLSSASSSSSTTTITTLTTSQTIPDCTTVSSPAVPETTDMQAYRQFLKDCYRQPLPDDDKLLTTASKHYIELAIISREGITWKEADEFTRKSLHGLTEEILCKKAPIALKDLLKPEKDGKPVRCVLIEGAPGIGKSTLAWEVCHKWEELDCVKQHELVVLVQLREKNAQEARGLSDLFPHNATTNLNGLLAEIGRGKMVLIICDGFDELPSKQQQAGSVYIDLIKGRLLPEATVIVTSRPSVSANLMKLCQHNIDRHLEVMGFTNEDIKRYAESVFSGDVLEGFLTYITNTPPIYGMMYIPLNTVIVALVYQDNYKSETPFPTTMTQLFDAITRALIRRHLVATNQISDDYCMPPHLQSMEAINSLLPAVAQQFLELAKVAYKCLRKNLYVLTEIGSDLDLGIMKKTATLNVCRGPGCSYSFLHLTLQVYMAAVHIAVHGIPSEYYGRVSCRSLLSEQSIVLRFLVGLSSHNGYYRHPFYQELVQSLSRIEYGSFVPLLLQLARCAYECSSIMDDIKIEYGKGKGKHESLLVTPKTGFDWYAIGYCISHFNERWGIVFHNMREQEIYLLQKGLNSSPRSMGRIHMLKFLETLPSLKLFYILNEFCQVRVLHLMDVSILNDDDEVVLQLLIRPGSELEKLAYRSGGHLYTDRIISFLAEQAKRAIPDLSTVLMLANPSHTGLDMKIM